MSPILKNSVHEMSPFESVHEKSPILKNSVHEMSLSTKCLHPQSKSNLYTHHVFELYSRDRKMKNLMSGNWIIDECFWKRTICIHLTLDAYLEIKIIVDSTIYC